MDIQFPPFLQKGDKVVIVSPSSKIDDQPTSERFAGCNG